MNEPVPLVDHCGLGRAEREALQRVIAEQTTLERVLDWGHAQTPALSVETVLAQDEYTHDVVLAYRNRYLVYDTT